MPAVIFAPGVWWSQQKRICFFTITLPARPDRKTIINEKTGVSALDTPVLCLFEGHFQVDHIDELNTAFEDGVIIVVSKEIL